MIGYLVQLPDWWLEARAVCNTTGSWGDIFKHIVQSHTWKIPPKLQRPIGRRVEAVVVARCEINDDLVQFPDLWLERNDIWCHIPDPWFTRAWSRGLISLSANSCSVTGGKWFVWAMLVLEDWRKPMHLAHTHAKWLQVNKLSRCQFLLTHYTYHINFRRIPTTHLSSAPLPSSVTDNSPPSSPRRAYRTPCQE